MTARQIWKILKNAARAPEIARCATETKQWQAATAAYLGLAQLQYPFTLQLRSGEQIPIEELTDLKALWQIFLRRVYRVNPEDRVILDLGANVGVFTLYAARQAPSAKIFAVEPFPATFRRLTANIRQHQFETRVHCLNVAVTGVNGIRRMPDAAVPSQRRALESAAAGDGIGDGTQVAGKTLAAILEENQLSSVDLVKMDIEGSEYEVLLSTSPAVLSRIRRIALEYHGDSQPYTKEQLFSHLRQSGFNVSRDVCDAHGYGVAELIRNG